MSHIAIHRLEKNSIKDQGGKIPMKKYPIQWIFALLVAVSPLYAAAEDIVLDTFDYEDDAIIFERYSNSGWQGTGDAFIYDDGPDGTKAMELYLTFDGGAWGGGAVISAPQEPFAFQPGQVVTLDIKGDPDKLGGNESILVFQFRDADGEVIRFLDYVGPKTATWTKIKMPYQAFEEGPWDPNPDVPADRNNLVTWEFYIQGVGGEPV
ncbi:MAG TPA: hypothetical protein PLQ45_11225, partial [Anaerohalosphaeraceae bacterium]|nr:hypothetical protein [Anaerohalosphaeraceae bacterium]